MFEAWFFWSGRLGRLAYLGYSFLLALILLGLAAILILPARNSPNLGTVLILAKVIVGAIGTWGGICLGVKRLHDLDHSGWHYAWMMLVPNAIAAVGSAVQSILIVLAGLVLSLGVAVYLVFWPGTDGQNRFGYRP